MYSALIVELTAINLQPHIEVQIGLYVIEYYNVARNIITF